jgi:hypothetical protein
MYSEVDDPSKELIVQLWDYNTILNDELIGEAKINLDFIIRPNTPLAVFSPTLSLSHVLTHTHTHTLSLSSFFNSIDSIFSLYFLLLISFLNADDRMVVIMEKDNTF